MDHGNGDEGLRREVVDVRDGRPGYGRSQDHRRSGFAASQESGHLDRSQRSHSSGK